MLKSPKADSSKRKVFIPKSVAQCLIELKKDQEEIIEALGNEYQNYNLVMATTFGLPIGDSYLRTKMQDIIDELGLPDVVFHSLRHPYVKHTTKNIILKSRKPKLPILVLIVWVFCFCFLFYDFARSIGGIISIISFKDYFCCSTAFFTAEI